MIEASVSPPQPKKHTPPKWVYQKYETIEAKFPRKAHGAQSSIEKKPIPPKDIGS
jgi:hypothetical protein